MRGATVQRHGAGRRGVAVFKIVCLPRRIHVVRSEQTAVSDDVACDSNEALIANRVYSNAKIVTCQFGIAAADKPNGAGDNA